MDFKKLYKEALERAKAGKPMDEVFPELKESEDERIRRLLVWQVHRNIEDETNDLAQSVYDGIKGHDPELEESIKDWKKCLAYLEKQKEQKPFSQEVFDIAKHEALWGEQPPAEWSEKDSRILYNVITYVGYAAGERGVRDDEFKEANSWLKALPERFNLQPRTEWSDEDEKRINYIFENFKQDVIPDEEDQEWLRNRLKSLRPKPHWKPSEEQMEALNEAINEAADSGSIHLNSWRYNLLKEIKEKIK